MRRGRPRVLRTLRGRLVTVVSGLLLIALALFGVVSVVILRQNLITQAVSTLYLSSDSAVNQTVLALDATGSLPAFDELSLVVPPDGFFLALEDDRADVAVSAFLTRDYTYRAMTGAEIDPVVAELDPSGLSVVDIAGMGSYLVTTVDVEEASGRTVGLVSGIGLADADAVIGTYALWVGGVGLAIAGFAAVFGWRWARHELAPLERVAEIAEDVTATPMSSGEIAPQRRAPRDERHRGSETDRVAAALNRLITHVELSMNSRHRAEESMRRFIAEASHELRNPLASIRGYADFYAQPDADHDETQGALRRIGAEAARMSGLVDDLLLLARLDADPEVARDEVELSRVAVETASDARFAYPGHTWRMSLPDEAVRVIGDESAIRQMLLNLVANAGHHTPAGTNITIAIELSDAAVDLVVADDGPGIPSEALPTIFDRFTQAGRPSETRERTTVGLGLAIVRALATASGYEIEVTSSPNGTRFDIRMPLGEPAAAGQPAPRLDDA